MQIPQTLTVNSRRQETVIMLSSVITLTPDVHRSFRDSSFPGDGRDDGNLLGVQAHVYSVL